MLATIRYSPLANNSTLLPPCLGLASGSLKFRHLNQVVFVLVNLADPAPRLKLPTLSNTPTFEVSNSAGTLVRKMTRTAADGDMHDATLAMDLDGTRHPLKNKPTGNLRGI